MSDVKTRRPCWIMDDVRFVQLLSAPSPFDRNQSLLALDAEGEVWVYDYDSHGWDLWEKKSVTESVD